MLKNTLLFLLSGFLIWSSLVLFLLFNGSEEQQVKDISRSFKVKPGQMFQTEGHYHLSVLGTPVAEYLVELPSHQWSEYTYLLVDSDFQQTDFHAQLVWKSGDVAFQTVPLELGKSGMAIIPRITLNENGPFEVYLQMTQSVDLGEVTNAPEFRFKRFELMTDSVQARLMYSWLVMTDLKSLKISSLNFWAIQFFSISFACGVLFALTIWIVIGWLLKVEMKVMVLALMSIWIIFSTPIWLNQWQMKGLMKSQFDKLADNNAINGLDYRLKKISDHLSQTITELHMENLPIMIMDHNAFSRTRLAYHLHRYNVLTALSLNNIPVVKSKKGISTMLMLISQQLLPECEVVTLGVNAFDDGRLIWSEQGYCLVKI